jgi:hypothetical protein
MGEVKESVYKLFSSQNVDQFGLSCSLVRWVIFLRTRADGDNEITSMISPAAGGRRCLADSKWRCLRTEQPQQVAIHTPSTSQFIFLFPYGGSV